MLVRAAQDEAKDLRATISRLKTELARTKLDLHKIMMADETEASQLRAKVQYLVDFMAKNLYGEPSYDEGGFTGYHEPALPEKCFTFPDGTTWYTTGHEPFGPDHMALIKSGKVKPNNADGEDDTEPQLKE
jgi:hypothetical protein